MHLPALILFNIYLITFLCIRAHINGNEHINVHNINSIKKKLCTKKRANLFFVNGNREIIIGTRDSPLAIKQSEKVQNKLIKYFKKKNENVKVILKPIKTTGDKILDKTVSLFGGKGIFTKELDEQLIKNKVDLCVHSLKDIPVVLPENIIVACYLKRDIINDALLSKKYTSLNHMDKIKKRKKNTRTIENKDKQINSNIHNNNDNNNDNYEQNGTSLPFQIVGTSSLRRMSQIKYKYKNIKIKEIRGNINTRIKKLNNGEYNSIIIAMCGLERLLTKKIVNAIIKNKKIKKNEKSPYNRKGNQDNDINKNYYLSSGSENTKIDLSSFIIKKINTKTICPALCQGIIAVTTNKENIQINQILKHINNEPSEIMATIERTFLKNIEGNCMMPIGGYAKIIKNSNIIFNAIINDIHGSEQYTVTEVGDLQNYSNIAFNAANKIKEKIGIDRFNQIKQEVTEYYK
ncbi:porphobilinogen deaminase [Hepatocystis sp. ex Piliocolobus tephrosceles]|nr:porphobilinogen deaminase [Hepatocystis sp. ex Piliocolobus tephrosceles]